MIRLINGERICLAVHASVSRRRRCRRQLTISRDALPFGLRRRSKHAARQRRWQRSWMPPAVVDNAAGTNGNGAECVKETFDGKYCAEAAKKNGRNAMI